MFFFSKLSKSLPVIFLILSSLSALSQSGNSGALKTTNSPFAGAVLLTDGTRYYWGTPTNLQASVTNAQPPNTTLTNISGTGISPGGTNASAYVGSSSGSGTNITFRGTLTSLFASTTTNSGDMGISGSLLVQSPGVFSDTLDAYSSFHARADSQYSGVATFNSNAVIGSVTHYPSASPFTTILSNAANNSTHVFGSGTYAVTPSILNSNLATGSMFQGAKLYNKTNFTLIGQPGQTIIDGSSALGEVLFISNCYNVTIKGFTFRGMTNHNVNALPDYSSYLWAGVNLYASARVRFEDCRFERHADHGLQDKGAEANSVGSSTIISTNMIEVINCYFTDIGGFRTNSGDGTIRGDGTAIVPTGWTIEGNTFQNCQRGIEPYDTADADGRLFYNCIMRNNKFYNMVEFAISPAGSTNGHNAQVIGNTLINDPSFSYHGTNWGAGGIPAVCQGFMLNGGRGWVVKDNYAKGAMYLGYSMISGATLDDFTLEGNTADFIDRGDSLGYGFWIGNSVNSAANASSVRRLTMRGNKTYKTYDSGILILAARDSVVDGNTVSTILRTNIGVSSSAFQVGAASMGSSIITNLTLQNNVAIDGNNDAAQPMNVAFGYAFAANLSNVKSINNHAFDFDIAPYTNLAGDNVRFETSIASDTNRTMRVRDLNGLLTQGANITLTPASDGSVTIAGGAGAGEANVNGEAAVTNATRVGLVNGKAGITNLLRSIEGGYGLGLTNRGTNIDVAITDAELIEWSGVSTNKFMPTNSVHLQYASSNNVRVAAGTGISVASAGSSGVQTFTVTATGSGSSGSNYMSITTNYFGLGTTNTGTNATQVIDMMGPQIIRSHANGNTIFVYTNMPAWTNAGSGSKLQHYIQHTAGTVTIASLHPIKFDPSLFIASGETNLVTTAWNGVEIIGTTSHAPLVFHSSVASTIVLDSQYSRSSIFSLTNRLTAATTLIATNLSDGKQMRINIIGEASGGTDRAITVIPDLGTLIVNMNTYAQSKTNSFVFTVTNGMFAEVSGETLRMNGTNTLKLSVAHASFQ